ncbi:MAG: hypothetical protein A3J37_05380 [Alphaproteobacteria bacterium RIFCSPHIGHO2_12_FULL_45_9]|nr:MAG: hypothetical protein A3B66_08795 [Alphaproteobacteria bacterium RIFCSPHIGHO2_02_FULL_46_13]OFW97698.1 MAG: hypothetical protein A3J37_05380 [Alphaproteobacteria bacterium RIFCSPHIGHO2_12_FULL_45_9]
MSAVPKPQELQEQRRQGQRSWTDAQRAEQAAKLHARKIWLKSTGPRTVEGKLKSSQNARSAGYAKRQELKAMCRYLRTQKSYIELISFYTKQGDRLSPYAQIQMEMRLDFFENELIDIERQMFHGLRFCEILSGNIILFPSPPT